MSLKNQPLTETWQPTISLNALKTRAALLQKIREFFAAKHILEVETPLLSHGTITDPHIIAMYTYFNQVTYGHADHNKLFLQTSPEYAMKRLLAAGSGPIYQICKAFRDGEAGRKHNPEFTMLEWYRPGFNHHDFMTEMDEFFQYVIQSQPAKRFSYADVFAKHCEINPHTASISELKNTVIKHNIPIPNGIDENDRNIWLDFLMSDVIEPHLGIHQPEFIYDYPVTQSALARIRHDNPPVAERFEVYINGIELANGFHELADAQEQYNRFENDLEKRQHLNAPIVPIDKHLIAALNHGLPDCSGVAIGIDRLMMIVMNAKSLSEVICFPYERA